MEASNLDECVMSGEMPAGGGSLPLEWDANKFTGDLGRRMGGSYRACAQRFEETRKAAEDAQPKKKKQGRRRADDESLVAVADGLAASLEITALAGEVEKEMYADALATDRYGILRGWGLTVSGVPVEPSFEQLMKRSTTVVKAIFKFCREESLPKKPEAGRPQSPETSPTISSPTSDISSHQTTPAQESRLTSNYTTSQDSSA
jgi:hypothetical protein